MRPFVFFVTLLAAISALGQVSPRPATQTEVDAGTATTSFVSPATLRHTRGGLPLNVVTNWPAVLIGSNNTVYANGQWYSFSNSTTSGINEAAQLAQFSTSNGVPSGARIELGPGVYPFTTPIVLTNDAQIHGAGYWATLLVYTGPTNLYTTNQIMAGVLPTYTGFSFTNTLTPLGLIQLGASPNLLGTAALRLFHFSDFGVLLTSNMPCVMIAGGAGSIYQERLGLFGAKGLKPNGDVNTTYLLHTTNSLAIGEAVWCANEFSFDDGWVSGLAAGVLDVGNSFFHSTRTEFVEIAYDHLSSAPANPNGYPLTNWLSVGPAIYHGNGSLTGIIDDMMPVQNNLDVWSDGDVMVHGWLDQDSTYQIANGVGGKVLVQSQSTMVPALTVLDPAVTSPVPNFVVTNTLSQATNGAYGGTFMAFGPAAVGDPYSFMNNGEVAWQVTAGDPGGNIYGPGDRFLLGPLLHFIGDGSGLTNTPVYLRTNTASPVAPLAGVGQAFIGGPGGTNVYLVMKTAAGLNITNKIAYNGQWP